MNTFLIECQSGSTMKVEASRIRMEGDFFCFVDEEDEPLFILVSTQVVSITKKKGET